MSVARPVRAGAAALQSEDGAALTVVPAPPVRPSAMNLPHRTETERGVSRSRQACHAAAATDGHAACPPFFSVQVSFLRAARLHRIMRGGGGALLHLALVAVAVALLALHVRQFLRLQKHTAVAQS